ncbi:MAG TPA: 2OG-Fe(II) oxygenase [Bdellovibrionota bacterium]|jgi:SM-20-related protein|nr:2OG-Fe(II) oxygenase [Bdellovibrionota bacterium]
MSDKSESATKLEQIMQDLCERGYSITPQALHPASIDQLKLFARSAHEAGHFKPASIGREGSLQLATKIRGDLSLWVDNWKQIPALEEFHLLVTKIMESARRELYLSVKRFEGHFAVYPPGAGYRAHLDQHNTSHHRQISLVLYLSDLGEDEGGELKIHNTLHESNTNITVRPTSGTLVAFLSGKIVHEVLPTTAERWSLTGWIRDDESSGGQP